MTTIEIIEYLKAQGSEQTKKILINHGAKEPVYGVKVEDMKKLMKKNKFDTALAIELYNTGISDAMYMAGLIANGWEMTKEQLQTWAEKANWPMISESTVTWVASESKYGLELALEWIQSDKENIASSGWATLSGLVAMKPDDELDFNLINDLFNTIEKNIDIVENRVKYTMNQFILSVACYVLPLHDQAIEVAYRIGKVKVDMSKTACKVPYVIEYIEKVKKAGKLGVKRKTMKC